MVKRSQYIYDILVGSKLRRPDRPERFPRIAHPAPAPYIAPIGSTPPSDPPMTFVDADGIGRPQDRPDQAA